MNLAYNKNTASSTFNHTETLNVSIRLFLFLFIFTNELLLSTHP